MNTETTELEQTSFEKEHKIEAGSPMTRNEVSQETPEDTKERTERDIEAGRRSPAPEKVDQSNSAVTSEQSAAFADAAPKATRSTGEDDGDKKTKKASSQPASHAHKK